ncbi:MAG: (2Fe-2S)-binding protein [Holophagaceae bacterium]
MAGPIRFRVNGKEVSLDTDGGGALVWALRGELGLTGTKVGCGEGLCGSCTVLVDGKAVRACQTELKSVAGREVTTIEGLAKGSTLHPLQRAFLEEGGFQCGFCTPGMVMNALALLHEHPHPTRAQIVAAMDDNLCRCGAHPRIVAAIEAAGSRSKGSGSARTGDGGAGGGTQSDRRERAVPSQEVQS